MIAGVTTNSLQTSTGSTGSVTVPEIYNSSTKLFKKTQVIKLCEYLLGTTLPSSGWYTTFRGLIDREYNAEDFRQTSIYTKTAGQDVKVTYLGLTWYAMYLYTDGYYFYLTLWLAQDQSSLSPLYAVYRKTCNMVSGNLYIVLDDGLLGADNYDDVNIDYNCLYNYTCDSHITGFSDDLCMDNAVILSDNILFPCQMPWQQNQSAREILGLPYDLPNEAWSVELPDSNFYSPDNNYKGTSRNFFNSNRQIWSQTRKWLPSLSEIGYSGVSGLWGASPEQRSCQTTSEKTVTINGTEYPLSNTTWTRSGNYKQSYGYYFVKSSGEGKGIGATYARVFRPCVHLRMPWANVE